MNGPVVSDKASGLDFATVTAIHDTMTQTNVLRRLKPSIVGALYVRFSPFPVFGANIQADKFPRSSGRQRVLHLPSLPQFRGVNSAGLLPFCPPPPTLLLPLIDLGDLINIRIGQRTFYASHYGGGR